jgi:hypothetical protein
VEPRKEEYKSICTEKYTFMSGYQNAGYYHDIKIADKSFENVVMLKYWGVTVSNEM